MGKTQTTLENLLDLLGPDKPDPAGALRLVKELVVKGACAEEVASLKAIAAMFLTGLAEPLLDRDPEAQALLGRLEKLLDKPGIPKLEAVSARVAEIAPALEGALGGEGEQGLTAAQMAPRVLTALKSLGAGEAWLVEEADKLLVQAEKGAGPELAQGLFELANRVATHGELNRTDLLQERERLKKLIVDLAISLGAVLTEAGQVDDNLTGMVERLKKGDGTESIEEVKAVLVREASAFQRQARSLTTRIKASQNMLKKSQERIRTMEAALQAAQSKSLVDPLTGLPNRYAFAVELSRRVKRAETLEEPFSIVLLEMAGLKEAVEAQGPAAMGTVLKAVAAAIPEVLKKEDMLARLSDARLGLIFPNLPPKKSAKRAERVRALFETPGFTGGPGLPITAALGLARHRSGLSAKEILQQAEQALGAAQEKGGNRLIAALPPQEEA